MYNVHVMETTITERIAANDQKITILWGKLQMKNIWFNDKTTFTALRTRQNLDATANICAHWSEQLAEFAALCEERLQLDAELNQQGQSA